MPRRGEFWWVCLDPAIGSEIRKTRPCVVLTSDVLNKYRRTVIVVPLSAAPEAGPPILVPLTCDGRRAVAVIDQIRAVSKERLRQRIGLISPGHLQAVESAVRQVLELE